MHVREINNNVVFSCYVDLHREPFLYTRQFHTTMVMKTTFHLILLAACPMRHLCLTTTSIEFHLYHFTKAFSGGKLFNVRLRVRLGLYVAF